MNFSAFGRQGPSITSKLISRSLINRGICRNCRRRLLSSLSSSAPQPAVDRHNKAVQSISTVIRDYYNRKEPFRISHGSTNSTRPTTRKNIVSTEPLSNVLHVDIESRTALVEPNVPMDRLVEATLQHGLVPPVVMEFPGITVGGGYNGTSGESSSFKHGFFNHTINSLEMVLADGEIIKASPTENSDLFWGGAGALGTLGVTTLVNLQLIPASKYVEATYHPVSSVSQATETVRSFTSKDDGYNYVDGILYSQNNGAIVTGKMSNTVSNNTIQRFSDAKDPWFYLHVKEMLEKAQGSPVTEAIPIAEYLFRYDRGGFWVGRSAFEYFNFPFNSFTRWWLDDFLHTRMMYKALHASGQSKRYVVQDLAVPYDKVEEFVSYTASKFGIWPLWLCPLKQSPAPTIHPHSVSKTTGEQKEMLNIGVWGNCPPHLDFVQANRDLEAKLKELGAMKWLYAQTYYTQDEFWGMFDKNWYDELRQKYRATGLPSVYDKVKIEPQYAPGDKSFQEKMRETWPFSGFYGIQKAIESGHYLEARKSKWRKL